MTLVQAQRRYIEKLKAIPVGTGKNMVVGARLELCRWAKRHGYDPTVVLTDARDVLYLELNAAPQGE